MKNDNKILNNTKDVQTKKMITIAISCAIAVVIIAGVIISIYSFFSSNKSVFDVLDSAINNDVTSESLSVETEEKNDIILKAIGETSSYKDLSLKLNEVNKEENMISDDEYNVYSYNFILTNNSDRDILFMEPFLAVYENYDEKFLFKDCKLLYTDIEQDNSTYSVVCGGDSIEFTTYMKIPDYDNINYTIEVSLCSVDDTNNYYFHFDPNPNNKSN